MLVLLCGGGRTYKNNSIITDASTSITDDGDASTFFGKTIIEYHNNPYKISYIFVDENGNEVEPGGMLLEGQRKYTSVEPLNDNENFAFHIMKNGGHLKTKNSISYYKFNNMVYKLANRTATEATAEDIQESKKVTVCFNAQSIEFIPTEGEKWIDWAGTAVEDIDLSSIQQGLTLTSWISQSDGTAEKNILFSKGTGRNHVEYSLEFVGYNHDEYHSGGAYLNGQGPYPAKTGDDIVMGGRYIIIQYRSDY